MARILVVDDSLVQKTAIRQILSRNGFDVIDATEGEEGYRLAVDHQPDVVLMDIVMPGWNGFRATRQFRRDPRTADIPIIVVSTKDLALDKAWSLRQGASAYLVKPVSEAALISEINNMIRLRESKAAEETAKKDS